MRIPLSVDKLYVERKGVYATFFIQIPAMRVAHALSGVVDTGSPYTAISPRDALSFKLPFKGWQKGELVYLAGFKFYRHELEATLTFKDADAKLARFRQKVIVLVPTKIDEPTLREMQNIPSLVGTDFMEDQGLTLVFDPLSAKAYFDKSDVVPASATNQTGTT